MLLRKKIYIYLTPCFPSPESWRGGFCYDAVKALLRDGRYDVRVMTSSPGEDYDYHGIHVYRFHKYALGSSDYFPFLFEPLKVYYFTKKLKMMGLKPSDIAVCHVHLFENYAPYATWLKQKNPKCLTLLHHHWTGKHELTQGKFDYLPGVKELLYLNTRKHLEAADAQVFCSEISRSAFAHYYPNGPLMSNIDMKEQLCFPNLFRSICPKDTHVCYNGIDSKLFYPRPRSSLPTSYRIGCVGNFTPQKSQKTLIEAVDILMQRHDFTKKIEVVFVGSGSNLDSCKSLAASICTKYTDRLDIVFKTEMHHDDMPEFYRSLDLFVLPSYYEAFNCVFIEALGCGIPIIGCNNISIREVLSTKDSKKWLFPPKDAKELAVRIEMAIHERPAPQKLTHNLDIDVVTRDFLDWVDKKRDSNEILQ